MRNDYPIGGDTARLGMKTYALHNYFRSVFTHIWSGDIRKTQCLYPMSPQQRRKLGPTFYAFLFAVTNLK